MDEKRNSAHSQDLDHITISSKIIISRNFLQSLNYGKEFKEIIEKILLKRAEKKVPLFRFTNIHIIHRTQVSNYPNGYKF